MTTTLNRSAKLFLGHQASVFGLLCAAVFLLLGRSAPAATITSTASGGLWTAITTWSGGAVPAAGDDVVIATTTGNQVTLNISTNAASVTINLGATLGFNNDNTNDRTLTLAGNLANNGTITIGTGGGTSPTGRITFSGAGRAWTGSGDVSLVKIRLTVSTGGSLDISGLTIPLKFRNSGSQQFTVNGTLITGTQVINGNGNLTQTYTFGASSSLVTANVNGIYGTAATFNTVLAPVFTAGASVTFNGAAAQATTGLPPSGVGTLTINNTGPGVTLSQATTVTNLTLTSGTLTTTAANLLTIASGGTGVTGGSSSAYVHGPLAQVYAATGPKTFPTGKGGNQRSVTLDYTALTGPSTVTVEQFESAMAGTLPANTAQFNSRYWTVAQSGGTGIGYRLMLDGTGFSPVGTAVVLQEGSPDASYSATFASPNYTATGLTSTGNFTLGDFTAGLDQLAFTTAPQTLTAGVISGTITVQLQDAGGTPKNAAAGLTVNLSSASGAGVFRDLADTTTITTVTIAAGNNSASFKYKDTTAPGTPTLTASGTGVASTTQQQIVNVGAAVQLGFTTPPVSTYFNYTMAPVVVQIQDGYGNSVPQSGTAITLTLNNGGAAVLTGTNPRNTDATGKATFSNLAVTVAPGTGLNLGAVGGSLPPVTSSNFDIAYRLIVKAKNATALDQAASWTGGVVPGANDTAVINNSSVGTSALSRTDFGASASWYGLIVSNWTANTGYTISNTLGGTLTLGLGGLVGADVNHSLTLSNHFALAVAQTWNWGDANSTSGTLNLNGNLDNNGQTLTVNNIRVVSVTGSISGSGGLVKQGSNQLRLLAANTYSGPTTVSGGTLRVEGSLDSSTTMTVTNSRLDGFGTVGGPVTIGTGGSLEPGSGAIGTLTLNSVPTLHGAVVMEINSTNIPKADLLTLTSGTLAYDGALTINNMGPIPQNGDTFKLFHASSGNYSGAFTSLTLSPGGLTHWQTANLTVDGTVTFTNNNPVAANFNLALPVGGAATVAVIAKYVTDADAGDTLTITAVSTPANGTVSIVGGTNLTYTSTNSAASDSFTYTVSDGLGGTDTKTVTVATYSPSPEGFNKLSGPTPVGGGQYTLTYLGIPGLKYALDETASLTPPITWSPVVTNTASGTGGLTFTFTTANPSGYFRTRYVP